MRVIVESILLLIGISFVLVWTPFLNLIGLLGKFIPNIGYVNEENVKRNTDFSVCSTLYSKGILTEDQFIFEKQVASSVSNTTYIGYVYLFFPVIIFLQNFSIADKLAGYVVKNYWMPKAKRIGFGEIDNINHVKAVNLIGDVILKLKGIGLYLYERGAFQLISIAAPILTSMLILTEAYKEFQWWMPIVATLVVIFFESIMNSGEEYEIKPDENRLGLILPLTITSYFVGYFSIIAYILYMKSSFEQVVMISMIVTPVFGGIGYPLAHEIGHKRDAFNKYLGFLLSWSLLLPFFNLIHNKGHHKDLHDGTDKVVAEYNESIIKYLFRQYKYIYKKVVELNTVQGILMILIQLGSFAIAYFVHPPLVILLVTMFVVSFTILEVVNYIEHYSISSSKEEANRSWDSDNPLTNGVLFNVGKHAQHHVNASVSWDSLNLLSNNRMPYGYVSQIFMAFFRGTWNNIVDRRRTK